MMETAIRNKHCEPLGVEQEDSPVAMSREAPSVCVIVLNWNRCAMTVACLNSLQCCDYPSVRLVMVDNGSADDSVQVVRESMPEVLVIENGANLGYAGGNNAAIRRCLQCYDDDFFLILNNDTIVAADFISELVRAALGEPQGAAFGPKILRGDTPQIISFLGGRWDDVSARCIHERDGVFDSEWPAQAFETDYLTGCAVLIRRNVMEALDGFDERFYLYYEDVDFSYRLRAKSMKCFVVPTSRIWHAVGGSTDGPSLLTNYFLSRNRLLFARKHLSPYNIFQLAINVLVEILVPTIVNYPLPDSSPWKRLYWLLKKDGMWPLSSYRASPYVARCYGIRDFLMGNFGDCPTHLRAKLDNLVKR